MSEQKQHTANNKYSFFRKSFWVKRACSHTLVAQDTSTFTILLCLVKGSYFIMYMFLLHWTVYRNCPLHCLPELIIFQKLGKHFVVAEDIYIGSGFKPKSDSPFLNARNYWRLWWIHNTTFKTHQVCSSFCLYYYKLSPEGSKHRVEVRYIKPMHCVSQWDIHPTSNKQLKR